MIIIEPGAIETEFGAVMAGPMLERSGESAYRDLAQALAKASMTGSPPTLIAELIVKAIKARRPRTRYVAGKYARPLLMTRRLLGDRVFDRVVMQVVR